jgi:Transposase IS66 family
LVLRNKNVTIWGAAEFSEPKIRGKRGRVAKTKAANLLDRFANHEKKILRFAQDSRVSFTDNLFEWDLRMNKVKKMSLDFFDLWKVRRRFAGYAVFFSEISTPETRSYLSRPRNISNSQSMSLLIKSVAWDLMSSCISSINLADPIEGISWPCRVVLVNSQ